MTSSIYFKMGWEKEMSKILFIGNQLRLKDLKEQIIEAKNLRAGRSEWNFDLKVVDANDGSKGRINILSTFNW